MRYYPYIVKAYESADEYFFGVAYYTKLVDNLPYAIRSAVNMAIYPKKKGNMIVDLLYIDKDDVATKELHIRGSDNVAITLTDYLEQKDYYYNGRVKSAGQWVSLALMTIKHKDIGLVLSFEDGHKVAIELKHNRADIL